MIYYIYIIKMNNNNIGLSYIIIKMNNINNNDLSNIIKNENK